MSAAIALFLTATCFFTSFLSGIFGMAGGLVLMGALTFVLPVAACFVVHGLIQMVANGWRAVLHRAHIVWPILINYAVASVVAGVVVAMIAIMPSRPVLYLLMGLVGLLVWLPKSWTTLDASRQSHALLSGFLVTLTNLTAGVAGPLLDVFFVRTSLDRHQIVATKAATQVFSHAAKIAVYGGFLSGLVTPGLPPWWLFAFAIPASMMGTTAGGYVLDRITDANFKRWTAWIVTAIAIWYLFRAFQTW